MGVSDARFLVLEGLDASGKSTQALHLLRFLKDKGSTVCLRLHPSDDNFFGIKARQFLYSRGKNAHFVSAFFYMTDVIRSILLCSWQKYDFLIFVRYLMGTAYLAAPANLIAYHFFALLVPKPDTVFFLDIRPQEAYRRILQTRREKEMFESIDELRKVRSKGLALASIGKWKIVDANMAVEEVEMEIRRELT